MPSKFKFFYAFSDVPSRSFVAMLSEDTTVEDFLKSVSKKYKKQYKAIFYEGSEIENDDLIFEYVESDPESIFYISTDTTPPTKEFMEDITKMKKGQKETNDSANPKNTLPKVAPPVQPHKNTPPKVASPVQLKKVAPPVQLHKDTPSKEVPIDIHTEIFNFSFYRGITDSRVSFLFHLLSGDKKDPIKIIPIRILTYGDREAGYKNILEALKKEINIDCTNQKLLVYFSGGIPYTLGKIDDFSCLFHSKSENLYGILTKNFDDEILTNKVDEICNLNNEENKFILSPCVDSTNEGLCKMSCLIGYLLNGGINTEFFLRGCIYKFNFPPLIASLANIIKQNNVNNIDVITACSSLYMLFKSMISENIPDNCILESSLNLCDLIAYSIGDISEDLPISFLDEKLYKEGYYYFLHLGFKQSFYCYKESPFDDKCFANDFVINKKINEENSDDFDARFSLNKPLMMNKASSCMIVNGKDHEYLFLKRTSFNIALIIDPMTGKKERVKIDEFAEMNYNPNLFENDAKEVLMIDIEETKSMDLNLAIYQYLTEFINKSHICPNNSIQGLVSFNTKPVLKCPLGSLISDFEEKGLSCIQPKSGSKLWDSISFCCKEITKFRKECNKNLDEAKSRILVIANGKDCNSSTKVEDLVKELMINKIIVDSVILNDCNYDDEVSKMLCVVSHITKGVSFCPKNIEEGLQIFERNIFININIDDRYIKIEPLIPGDRLTFVNRLKPEMITKEFMDNVEKKTKYNAIEEINYRSLNYAKLSSNYITPICYFSRINNKKSFNFRIMKEYRLAALVSDPSSSRYDPNLKIMIMFYLVNQWNVYLKGPDGTPYENKWWHLSVIIPNSYPSQVPVFRFVTVPYHLNISSDGKICSSDLENHNTQYAKNIIEYFDIIREVLRNANPEIPFQIDIYDLFRNDRNKYDELAKQSSIENAKDSFDEFLDGKNIYNDVPENFSINSYT